MYIWIDLALKRTFQHRFLTMRIGITFTLLLSLIPLTASPAAAYTGPITNHVVWDSNQTITTDVVVGNGGILTIEYSTTTFADADASPSSLGLTDKIEILVNDGGTLIINPGAELIAAAPGDWGGIIFFPGSTGSIQDAIIRDATQGVYIVSATVDIQNSRFEDIVGDSGDHKNADGQAAIGISVVGTGLVTLNDNSIDGVYAGSGYSGNNGQVQAYPGNSGSPGGMGGAAMGISATGSGDYSVNGNYATNIHGGAGGAGGNGESSTSDGDGGGDGGAGGEGGYALGLYIVTDAGGAVRGNRIGSIRGGSGGAGGVGHSGMEGKDGIGASIDGGSGGGGGNGGHGGLGGEAVGLAYTSGPSNVERNRVVLMVQGGAGGIGGSGGIGGQGGDGYESPTPGESGGNGGSGGSGGLGSDGGRGGRAIGFQLTGSDGFRYQFNSIESVIRGGNGAHGGNGGNGAAAGKGANGTGDDSGVGGSGGDGGLGGHGGDAGASGSGGDVYGFVMDELIAVGQVSVANADLQAVPILSASNVAEVQGGYPGATSTAGNGADGGAGGWGGSGLLSGYAGLGGGGGSGGDGSAGGMAGGAMGILNESDGWLQNNTIYMVRAQASSAGGDGGFAGDGGYDGGAFLPDQALGGNGGDGGNGGAGPTAAGIRTNGNAKIVHNSGASLFVPLSASLGGKAGSGGYSGGAHGSAGSEGSPPEAYGVLISSGEPTVQYNVIAPPAVGAALASSTSYGLYMEPAVPQMTSDYNLVQGWPQNYGPGVVPGPNDINDEPRYRDAAIGDLHLAANSPAIDAGAQTGSLDYLPLQDMDNESRPNGTAYDIGADEYYPCVAISSVSFSTPKLANPGEIFTINVAPVPANASQPIHFEWSPEPLTGQGTSKATYRSFFTGYFYVTIEYAIDCGGRTGGYDSDVRIVEPLHLPAMLVNQ